MSTVRNLFDDNRDALGLSWVVDEAAEADPEARAKADSSFRDAHLAATDLIGYYNLIHPDRIQVVGTREVEYFTMLSESRRAHWLLDLGERPPPAVIFGDGHLPNAEFLDACERAHIALIASTVPAVRIIEALRSYLAKTLAERTTMHGVLMDVLGVGIIITGESGLGKSELGLELISRGHGLVADDVVELARVGPNTIEGHCPLLLANLLEVRGLGLLDIKSIFGETAVRRKMRLRMIVHLVKHSTLEEKYQRLPLDVLTQNVLGIEVRKVVIPVGLGRNTAVLVEAAVRNTILQLRGIDTLGDFMVRQVAALNENSQTDG
ncbi:MAG: HPr(Ser) kinase/phosphatase [Burkholderiaceae bacterium]